MAKSDLELADRYLAGEPDVLALVDDWIEGASLPFRRRLEVRWKDQAQEIRVEVLGVLRSGAFEGRSSLKTYVWRLATHSCLDAVRRLDRVREVDPEPVFRSLLDPAERADDALGIEEGRAQDRILLSRVLSQMGEGCITMWRSILAGQSYQQMSEDLGVSTGTLRVRVARCREKARAARTRILRRTELGLAGSASPGGRAGAPNEPEM